MKKLPILIFTICCWINTNAQTHNVLSAHCKFSKAKVDYEGQVCVVCSNNEKKNKDAKLAEANRQAKIISDKYKGDKIASENARKAKQMEEVKNAHSGEVLINGSKNSNISVSKEQSKIANNVTEKNIMIGKGGFGGIAPYFENEKKERILENKDWTDTESIIDNSYTADCVNNMGIVKIGDPNGNWKLGNYYYNLVNSKGEYILNSTTISRIYHINDGWFILKDFDTEHPYCLYNIKSRKKILLENFSIKTTNTPLELYVPLFSNIKEISGSVIHREINYSIDIKKKIIERFQAQITEELLSKYSFVLVHTNGLASKLAERYSESEFNDSQTILLFCLKKTGELITIKLK